MVEILLFILDIGCVYVCVVLYLLVVSDVMFARRRDRSVGSGGDINILNIMLLTGGRGFARRAEEFREWDAEGRC